MSKAECVEPRGASALESCGFLRFVQKAIALALTRDGSSGGMVRTLTITKDKAPC